MIWQPIRKHIEYTGQSCMLFAESVRYLPSALKQIHRIIDHAYFMGYMTLPIVGVLSFFIGAVLALETGFSLGNFSGAQQYLGNIVGLSMCQELGPVMTSLLLAGRVGSAITAEVASMRVYQEVDVLQTMNIAPARIIVMPRLVAIFFMMPILTIFSVIIGWYGGAVISETVSFIKLDPNIYWRGLKSLVDFGTVWDGLVKAEIFGLLIVLISCNEGLRTSGGPREIGRAVTRSVVVSMVAVLFLNYFITKVQL